MERSLSKPRVVIRLGNGLAGLAAAALIDGARIDARLEMRREGAVYGTGIKGGILNYTVQDALVSALRVYFPKPHALPFGTSDCLPGHENWDIGSGYCTSP